MKKMKKILSVILTLAMVLGMSVTTFAVEGDPNPAGGEDSKYKPISKDATGQKGDRGKITIDGFEFEKDSDGKPVKPNLKITAYQIVKAVYANNETMKEETDPETNQTVSVGQGDGFFSGYDAVYKDETALGGKNNVIDTTATENKDKVLAININHDQLTAVWNYLISNDSHRDTTVGYKYVENINTVSGDETVKITDNNNGTFSVALDGLPVGSYLVAITGSEGKIYNPVVASIYYDVKNNGAGNIMQQGNFSILSDPIWPKVTNSPSVDKNIVERDKDKKIISMQDHGSANIGDHIEYQVVINPIPEYEGQYPLLYIEDTLSKGLKYDGNSVEVRIYDANAEIDKVAEVPEKLAASYYEVTEPNVAQAGKQPTTLKVNFVTATGYTLNEFVGKKAVITYKATLTNDAAINEGGNTNGVQLKFTQDSRTSTGGKPIEKEVEDKTYTYTFDIAGGVSGTNAEINAIITTFNKDMLLKTGEIRKVPVLDADGKPVIDQTTGEPKVEETTTLPGAIFTLYKDEKCTQDYVYTNESVVKKEGGTETTFNGTISSTEDGRLPVKGLKAGTYYLKETQAPTGYSLNSHVFRIDIEASYHDKDSTVEVTLPNGEKVPQYKEGELASWSIKIDGTEVPNSGTTNTFTVNHEGETTTKTVYVNQTVNEGSPENGTIAGTEIKNTKIASLPSTGGIGTTIFTFGGCAIMILAAALFFISRRKSAK